MAPELVSPLCRETSQPRGPQFYQLLVAEVLSGAGRFACCDLRVGYGEALEEPPAMGSTPCETHGVARVSSSSRDTGLSCHS